MCRNYYVVSNSLDVLSRDKKELTTELNHFNAYNFFILLIYPHTC